MGSNRAIENVVSDGRRGVRRRLYIGLLLLIFYAVGLQIAGNQEGPELGIPTAWKWSVWLTLATTVFTIICFFGRSGQAARLRDLLSRDEEVTEDGDDSSSAAAGRNTADERAQIRSVAAKEMKRSKRLAWLVWAPLSLLTTLVGIPWVLLNTYFMPHGRPLRLRGKSLRATVKPGDAAASVEWSAGPVPAALEVAALSSGTRGVLARMWREDGRTEHASVPAFTRMSWQLMGVGAPASLVSGCHRAAMEEVEHAQRCFALARAYGATDTAVQAMPSLLASAASEEDSIQATVAALVRDNVVDGGLMEGLSADVVGARAAVCEVAEVREVLEQIAREERSHAALSWAALGWLREAYPLEFESALTAALKTLERESAPRWSSQTWQTRAMGADPHALRHHGGPLDAAETRELWDARMAATRTQATEMLRRAGDADAGEVA